MRPHLLALAGAAFLLLAFGALVSACGGNGDEPGNGARDGASPELEAYYTQVETIAGTLRDSTRPLFQALASSNDLTALKAAFAQLPAELADYVEGMQGVEPPEEAAAAHAEVVAAAQAFLTGLESVNGDVQAVVGLNEFVDTASNVELPQASQTLETACLALEKIAQDNEIEVDLACGAI